MDTAAVRLVRQASAHRDQYGVDFPHLAINPRLAALCFRSAFEDHFHSGQQRRIHQAIGQRFPGFDFSALASLRGNQFADRRKRVQVLNNNARIKHRLAAFHHQARYFAERV